MAYFCVLKLCKWIYLVNLNRSDYKIMQNHYFCRFWALLTTARNFLCVTILLFYLWKKLKIDTFR